MTASTATPTARAIQPSPGAYELPARDLHDLLSEPPIDRERLLEHCSSNLEFALMLLDEFSKTTQSRLDELDTALAAGNYAAIASKAHALKGVAGILAANTLQKICSSLESIATNANSNQTCDLIQQLHRECQRTITFIPAIQATRQAPRV